MKFINKINAPLVACIALWLSLTANAAPLTDSRGRVFNNAKAPQRIVSGALASDEVVFELLQRTVHLDRLVALSSLADDPAYSNVAPVPTAVSGRFGGELESALKLKPDLVLLASYNKPDTLRRLDAAKIPTYVLGDFTHIADIEASITTLGALIHEPRAAAALLSEMKERLARLAKTKPARPLRVLQYFPDGSVSGGKTLFDEIVRIAGGVNLAAERGLTGWPRIGVETLAGMHPDLVVASGDAKERDGVLAVLKQTPGWRDMPAVKKGQVAVIPGRELGAVSHHIVNAIEALQIALRKQADDDAK